MPIRTGIVALLLAMLTVLSSASGKMAGAAPAPSASDWKGIPEAEVRLIAGRTAGGVDMIGLDFVIAPKWKVYWRSPGDAGFPPVPDWTDSTGVVPGDIAWPLPRTFMYYGLRTYGYEERLILPVAIRSRDQTRPTTVKLHLNYAACADICVPIEADLTLTLPQGDLPQNRHGKAIARALNDAPARASGALRDARISLRAGSTHWLELTLGLPTPIGKPDIIIEGVSGLVFDDAACTQGSGQTLTCAVQIDGPRNAITAQRGQAITVTVSGNGSAFETTGLVATSD